MKIRGFRYIVIVTVMQLAIVPRIDVLERREISRTRRIIDGIKIDSFNSNLLA